MKASDIKPFNKKELLTECARVSARQNFVTKEVRTYIDGSKTPSATFKPKLKDHYVVVDFPKVAEQFVKQVRENMAIERMAVEIKKGTQEVRLYGPDFKLCGDTYQRMAVLVSSTDGTRKLQVQAGLMRFVCSNGMIVSDGHAVNFKVKHLKSNDQVINALQFNFGDLETAFKATQEKISKIEKMKPVKLSTIRKKLVTTNEDGTVNNAQKYLAMCAKLGSSKTDKIETLSKEQRKQLRNNNILEISAKDFDLEVPAYKVLQCYTEAFRSTDSSFIQRETDRILGVLA